MYPDPSLVDDLPEFGKKAGIGIPGG